MVDPDINDTEVFDIQGVTRLFKRRLGGRSLVIVSNREPYAHYRVSGKVCCQRPAGGLTAALDPVMQVLGGTWVAWGSGSADRDTVDERGKVRVPPAEPRYTLKRIWLSDEEVEGYYFGFSNRVLWPLFHMLPERIEPSRGFWQFYERVNRKFAKAVVVEANPEDLLFIQDYHLALLPEMVRASRPEVETGLFWHIPWPPYDIFRFCPHRRRLLQGLLGADLLGFQTPRYAHNFLDCVRSEVGALVDFEAQQVTYRGHKTRVGSYPISVDYKQFATLATSERTLRRMQRITRWLGLEGRRVGIGVDRLDYSKGILQRLEALDRFLERFPQYREQLVFVQVAVPSRTEIGQYRQLSKEVASRVEALNAKYMNDRWKPIRYFDRPFDHQTLAALYRLADFAMVTSFYDGMNLVAKEYIACQVDEAGVLLLSETAGAYEDLGEAVPLNAVDPEKMVEAIWRALEMPETEKRGLMRVMRRRLMKDNIYSWMVGILGAIAGEEVPSKKTDARRSRS